MSGKALILSIKIFVKWCTNCTLEKTDFGVDDGKIGAGTMGVSGCLALRMEMFGTTDDLQTSASSGSGTVGLQLA